MLWLLQTEFWFRFRQNTCQLKERELDGGVYDNPLASVSHAVEEILGDQVMGFADCKVISYEELMEQVQIRNRITPEQAKCLEEGRPSILERIERGKQEMPEEGRKKGNGKNKDAALE